MVFCHVFFLDFWGFPTILANWDRYSVKGSSGVLAGMLGKLMFKSVFLFLGKSFLG